MMPTSLPPPESASRLQRRPSYQDRFMHCLSVFLVAVLTVAILLFGQQGEDTPRSQTAPLSQTITAPPETQG